MANTLIAAAPFSSHPIHHRASKETWAIVRKIYSTFSSHKPESWPSFRPNTSHHVPLLRASPTTAPPYPQKQTIFLPKIKLKRNWTPPSNQGLSHTCSKNLIRRVVAHGPSTTCFWRNYQSRAGKHCIRSTWRNIIPIRTNCTRIWHRGARGSKMKSWIGFTASIGKRARRKRCKSWASQGQESACIRNLRLRSWDLCSCLRYRDTARTSLIWQSSSIHSTRVCFSWKQERVSLALMTLDHRLRESIRRGTYQRKVEALKNNPTIATWCCTQRREYCAKVIVVRFGTLNRQQCSTEALLWINLIKMFWRQNNFPTFY